MLRLKRATALCYRLFDVAAAIDLEASRRLITKETRRLTLKRGGSEYIQVVNPPVHVELGERTLALARGPTQVEVGARLFDFGAVSIVVRVALPGGVTVPEVTPLVAGLSENQAVDALALAECQALLKLLGPAFQTPHLWEKNEEYTVVCVREIEGTPPAAALLAEPGLARLVVGEDEATQLSQAERDEVLQHHFSYTDQDLAVVEWNGAVLVEPSGSEDIIDLLEFANAQLLELRYYDDVLDRELGRVYDAIGTRRRGSLFFSPYKRLSRDLMRTLIDLQEFVGRVENALKIVGDVYLARVYEAALTQMRVHRWTEEVTRKQRLLQQTYSLLKGEVDTDRSLTLELMIVILIVLEIAMALFQVAGH